MKYTYEGYYRSHRPDGRLVSSQAAWMEHLRRTPPLLSVPEGLTAEAFPAWRDAVRAKVKELLRAPDSTPQPAPTLLYRAQREGYRAEKWEFYPDDISAVPVIMLIPDSATADTPAPVVFCFTGAFGNKEVIADEPLTEGVAGHINNRFPERNRMGRHYVENGMIAVCFDPLGMGECALDPDDKSFGWHSRTVLSHYLLAEGYSYLGISVKNVLTFLEYVKTLPFADSTRIATSGHSLGSEVAIYTAMVSDDISAVVFNDMCASHRDRAVALTEHETMEEILSLCLNFYLLPGSDHYFGLKDLCAALAPRPLAMNEGGPDCYFDEIRSAYRAAGAEENLQLTHYPKYSDPASRVYHDRIPDKGLSVQTHFDYSYTDPSDHSFRSEPSLALLKKHFGL